jgi:hypothetical protein
MATREREPGEREQAPGERERLMSAARQPSQLVIFMQNTWRGCRCVGCTHFFLEFHTPWLCVQSFSHPSPLLSSSTSSSSSSSSPPPPPPPPPSPPPPPPPPPQSMPPVVAGGHERPPPHLRDRLLHRGRVLGRARRGAPHDQRAAGAKQGDRGSCRGESPHLARGGAVQVEYKLNAVDPWFESALEPLK